MLIGYYFNCFFPGAVSATICSLSNVLYSLPFLQVIGGCEQSVQLSSSLAKKLSKQVIGWISKEM